MNARPGERLRPRTSPLRLFLTPAPWAATAYLVSYLVTGPVMFAFLVVVLVVAGVANITWLGLPLLVGAAELVRGCSVVERWRALLVGSAFRGEYRPVVANGILTHVRTRWTDPAILHGCAYFILIFPLMLIWDAAALLVWLTMLALVTLPLWFWAIPQTWPNGETGRGLMIGSFPDGPDGGGVGLWIGDIGTALLVAAGGLVLAVLVGAHLVTAAARLHVGLARRMLGPPLDPLADAKRVLAGPGPLPDWTSTSGPRRP